MNKIGLFIQGNYLGLEKIISGITVTWLRKTYHRKHIIQQKAKQDVSSPRTSQSNILLQLERSSPYIWIDNVKKDHMNNKWY